MVYRPVAGLSVVTELAVLRSSRHMRGASEDYALLQARAIRDNFGADWGIAESGSVGGSSHPSGAPAGRSCVAVVGPDGLERVAVTETGSDDRIANMEAFTRAALDHLEAILLNAST